MSTLRRILRVAAAVSLLLPAGGCDEPSDAPGGGSAEGGGDAGAPSDGGNGDGGKAEGGAADGPGGGGAGEGGSGGAPGVCNGSGVAGDFDRTLSFDGDDRRFLLHVPASYDPAAPARLVIAMHGFTAAPEEMREVTHLDQVADERGFIVAYPEGKNGSWNGGTCCGSSEIGNVDDVGFVGAMIDAIASEYCIDPSRVHATGFSNGGFLSHRLGCELSERIASIAVVAGQESLPSCSPSRPIPVLQMHGDADFVVPLGGNPILDYPSTESTVTGWAERNGCPATPAPIGQVGDATCERYAPCEGDAVVELCTVSGGGHDWFGGGSAWVEGVPPDGFVATLAAIDFFEAHALE